MTTPLNPDYDLKALILAPTDPLGREWQEGSNYTMRQVRVGTEARQFRGYHRDLPVYIVHVRGSEKETLFVQQVDLIRERFKTTREVFL